MVYFVELQMNHSHKNECGHNRRRTISSSTLLHFKYPRPFKANRVREKERDEEERDERENYTIQKKTTEHQRESGKKTEREQERERAKGSD